MAVSGASVVDLARTQLGVSYVWGGNTWGKGLDCSGLVQQTFKRLGINLPRVTYQQIGVGASVSMGKLRQGDLVFFDTNRSRSGPDHVGIYIGGGKFIHAPRPGSSVKIGSLTDSYYSSRWMGGRRVPGVAGSATTSGPVGYAKASQPVKATAAELAERYGMSKAFFDSHGELKRLFDQAVKGQWTAERFKAALKNTKWWKTTTSSHREAQILADTNPATYKANLEAARATAAAQAVKVGAVLSKGALNKLAKNMVHMAWNEAQINTFLAKYVKFVDDHTLGGQAGAIQAELQKEAYNNGMKVSDDAAANAAGKIIGGVSTMEKELAWVRQQAMGAFPAFADQIGAGADVVDVAQPYIQMLSQELQLPSTDITLWNPKIRSALTRMNSQGKPEPMSMSDFQVYVRSDPGWRKTTGAADRTLSVAKQVLADMGLVGAGG